MVCFVKLKKDLAVCKRRENVCQSALFFGLNGKIMKINSKVMSDLQNSCT